MQKFAAHQRHAFSNGAIGWTPGGPFDCLGPYAKVQNCPITGSEARLTCYASGYADSYFSVPACTRYRGRYVSGYFTCENGAVEFHPHDKYKHWFLPGASTPTKATRYLHEVAGLARKSGVGVEADRAFGTVLIDWGSGEAFMQGYEAEEFIAEVDALCKRYPSLTGNIAELALAWPYFESLAD